MPIPTFDHFDQAIIHALRKNPQGMRYNELHRNSGKEHGGSIWIKTFDSHLKMLVNLKVVEKHEESRYKVFYKLVVPDDALPAELAEALKERRKADSWTAEKIAGAVSKLYPMQEGDGENKIENDLDLLLTTTMYIMGIHLIEAILTYGEHPALSELAIDDMIGFVRKNVIEIATVVGQNHQTRLFFIPIWDRILTRKEEEWQKLFARLRLL